LFPFRIECKFMKRKTRSYWQHLLRRRWLGTEEQASKSGAAARIAWYDA